MKISTSLIEAAPPANVPCESCGAPVSGACSLVVHVIDNPDHGRPDVNAFTCYQFCGPACRSAWWNLPTSERCFPVHGYVTSPSRSTISALIIHSDLGARRPVTIESDDGALLAQHSGEVAAQYDFAGPSELERWWSGEVDITQATLPMKEKSSDV